MVSIEKVKQAIVDCDREGVNCAERELQPHMPSEFFEATALGVETKDWAPFSKLFAEKKFAGDDGAFVIVAPYLMISEEEQVQRLTVLSGRILDLPEVHVQGAVEVVPIEVYDSTGNDEEGFVFPTAWNIPGAEHCPALNNVVKLHGRIAEEGLTNLKRIFDQPSYEFFENLVTAKNALEYVHRERCYHEAGHEVGIGIKRKFGENLLRTYRDKAIEEWRCDAMGFELLNQNYLPEEAGKVIAMSLCLRLGVDGMRSGGTEVMTFHYLAMLLLHTHLESGVLALTKNGLLSLRFSSFEGLSASSLHHIQKASNLTDAELALQDPTHLSDLYSSVQASQKNREVFYRIFKPPHQL